MNGKALQISVRARGAAFVRGRLRTMASRIAMRLGAMLVFTAAIERGLGAAETNSTARVDYQSFRIISERNIFNANRSPRSARSPRTRSDRPVRTESFALVGTMSYEKGRFAFFEGSSSQYQIVCKPADTIAGYKVADIAPNYVKLESNGKAIEMRVGMQMKRQEEGEWLLGARTEPTATSNASPTSAEQPGGSSAGDESDVVKRLMQKRQQEENPGASESAAPETNSSEKRSDEKPGASSAGETDDAAKKPAEKREQELKNEKP